MRDRVMKDGCRMSHDHNACPRCSNTLLWWRSRTGRRVCMVCHADPLKALQQLVTARGEKMDDTPAAAPLLRARGRTCTEKVVKVT